MRRKRTLDLVFNEPLSDRSGWPKYPAFKRLRGESLKYYNDRIERYQGRYFALVRRRPEHE